MRQRKKSKETINGNGIVSLYLPKSDRDLWIFAAHRADQLGMSRSQYIATLIEQDRKKLTFLGENI